MEHVTLVRGGVPVADVVGFRLVVRSVEQRRWSRRQTPRLRNTGGLGGLVRMLLVETSDHGMVQYVSRWDPGPLLRTVGLPVHHVLEVAERVGWTPVDETRGRRRKRNVDQGNLQNWFDLGHMEEGMNMHGAWELEPHSRRNDDSPL